jgi:hypothetical protein
MGRTIWWPMHEKSESKIRQQDRQDRVVQTKKKRCRDRVRVHVKMMGKGSYLFIHYCPVVSGTCVLRGQADVCGVLVCGLRLARPRVFMIGSGGKGSGY